MQLHVNDQPREAFEARDQIEMIWYVLKQWNTDWRGAEVWQSGICICRFMRLPFVGYSFVVVAWTEQGEAHVNIYDVESSIVSAYQSGTVRLV